RELCANGGREMAGRGRKVLMSQPTKVQEPSMEEILASIRRIISDDDVAKPASAPAVAAAKGAKNSQDDIGALLAGSDGAEDELEKAPPAGAQAAPDALELTESMQAKTRALNGVDRPIGVAFEEAQTTERPAPEEPRATPVPDRSLLSPRTTAAV